MDILRVGPMIAGAGCGPTMARVCVQELIEFAVRERVVLDVRAIEWPDRTEFRGSDGKRECTIAGKKGAIP